MFADVTIADLGMAAMFLVVALFVVAAVIWAVLRHDNKVGPLAAAEQQHTIETHRVESILKAKRAEAQIALADAEIIKAKATVVEAQARATELDMERLDRQLTRGNGHREAE